MVRWHNNSTGNQLYRAGRAGANPLPVVARRLGNGDRASPCRAVVVAPRLQHLQVVATEGQQDAPGWLQLHGSRVVEITGDGSVTIADLGSRNGSAQVTALHNRVLGQGVSYIVEHRDVFYFGCCAVHFLLGAAPSSPSSRPAKRVVRKRERWNAAGMCAPRLAEAAASSFLRLSLGM